MPNGRMGSVDASRFSMVPRSDVPRSSFDVQYVHKTTFTAGYLIPLHVDEVLPGDSCRLRMHVFARGSTPLVPIMDNLFFESFFFFVPMRLIWSNWERFMGEQASPTDTTEFLLPQVVLTGGVTPLLTSDLADYFGITINGAGTVDVTSLPFRAYNLIWNEWFRDQDLQVKAPELTGDGPDAASNFFLLSRAKKKDYFTSARPWPFKPLAGANLISTFDPLAPSLGYKRPLAGAPVSGLGVLSAATTSGAQTGIKESGERVVDYADRFIQSAAAFQMRAFPVTSGVGSSSYPDVRVLVNDIRIANTVQLYMEKMSRGGSRYTESVRTLFGVTSPDARLQRPEYLGGGRSMVSISPVTQTAPTGIAGTTTAMGEQAGTAQISAYDHGFSASFTEHGYIIGLINIRSEQTYQQGVNRLWNRRTMFDFYSPPFAHLGEQAIQQKEIYSVTGGAANNAVFGYQERWAEYKYKPSRTSGYFRSTAATPLDMWHLGVHYTPSAPVLNNTFIADFPPVSRVMQVADNWGQAFLLDSMFEIKWTRAMPMFSIPGLSGVL